MEKSEGSGERLPAGELDVWLLKPQEENDPWAVITIQIELESPLTPESVLKYVGTFLVVDALGEDAALFGAARLAFLEETS